LTTSPTYILTLLLLGLTTAAVLSLGMYLLYRALRVKRVVVHDDDAQDPGRSVARMREAGPVRRPAVRDMPWQLRRLAIPLLLLSWVFLGKYLLVPFFQRGDPDSAERQPASTTLVDGASGAKLAVTRYGNGTGTTLVLTHGWGADRRDWTWVLNELPPGLSVVTWDLPGLGSSGEPRDYEIATLAGDLDSVVSTLQGHPVVLVGHSVGGMLNIEYARRFPQKLGQDVRGIVQVNTTYTNPLATKKNAESSLKLQKPVLEPAMRVVSTLSPVVRALGWLAYSSGMAHLQLASQSFAGAETWRQLDEMARYAYRSSPGVIARGVLGMMKWDGSAVLSTINVPTLIISGNQDVTTLPIASDRMQRDIPGATRVDVDPAAHMGPVEQAERYAEAISGFASGRTVAEGSSRVAQTGGSR
jgi:pimeloyl-ACP methyl ester carboxylesterase